MGTKSTGVGDEEEKEELNITYYKTEDKTEIMEPNQDSLRNQTESPMKVIGDVGSKFFKSNLYSAASAIRKKQILIPIRQKTD